MSNFSQMTDEQWLTATRSCPPESRILGWVGDKIAVRRPDGTGVLIDPAGVPTEIDKYGNVVTDAR